MQHKIKLLNKEENWHRLRNYKPNDTVNHNNKLWQNVTGLNSEPNDTSNDWVDINLGVSEKDLESKLDKPTEFATENSHSYVVVIDDAGGSAKRNATDFGKVRSVNGKEGDVILKTSDLENDSDYTTNATLTAHTSNKANPHNVTKEQIGLWNVDNTSDLNKPISTATQTELNKTGNLPSLTTANKNNLVDAINEVNNIQIGGRNLVLNSKRFINDKGIWVGDFDLSEKLEIGKKYSIAINIGLQNQDSILYINNQTGGTLSLLNNLGGNLHQATFIATENIDKILLFQSMNENWFDFMQMKLEKGNKATDWTPAPEGQVSDWNETDSTKFSFIKNKPTIPTVNNGQLTLSTGTGLSGSANFTANQAEESTFSVSVANTHKLPNTAEWDDTLKKDESNIVTDDFSMLQENGAYVSIASNGLKVGFGGITATYGNSNISVDNLVPDAAYQFQELLFPKRAVKNVEEKVYPVTYIQGVKADETGRVDISGVAWNYTNPSIRYSGILDKSADATYNQLLGVDSNGYAAKVGLNAVTNAMSKSTDAQKEAWRVANRKSDETYSIGVPRVDYCYPYIVDSRKDYLQYVFFYGINLFLDLKNSSLKLVNIATSQEITIDNFEVVTGLTTFLKIGLNFNLIPNGEYHLVITNPLGFTNIDTYKFTVSNSVQQVDLSAFEIANENLKIGTDFQSSISPKNITFQNLAASSSSAQAMARRLVTKSQSLPVTGNFILDFNFNVLKSENLADNNTGIQHSFGIVSSGSVLTDSGITPSIGYQFKAVNIGLFSSSKVIAYAEFPSGLYRARIVRQNGQFEVSIVLPNNTVLSDIIPDTLGSTIDIVSNFTGFYVSNSAQIVFELLSITN